MDRMKEQAQRLGARMSRRTSSASGLTDTPSRLTPREGRKVSALSVIIATGATPRRLNIPSESRLQGKGVSNCAVCDGFFFKGKKVAVVGGGDTAMEEATFLTNLASSIQVIHRKGESEGERRPA